MHKKIKQNIDFNYFGKITSCYSQALLSSFNSKDIFPDLFLFEIYTTIPFGITFVPNDPNRLINSYIDPDIGLDRVLNTVEINFEINFFKSGTDGLEAFELLKKWLSQSCVVLGPLDMGKLKYHFHSELFKNMDHYIVINKIVDDDCYILDPEGYVSVILKKNDLMSAWKGENIPEGRGEFIMRRIKFDNYSPKEPTILLLRTLKLAIENLKYARELDFGGERALLKLKEIFNTNPTPSFLRGLTFAIPTRIQRCLIINKFIHFLTNKPFFKGHNKRLLEVEFLITQQIKFYSIILADIIEKKTIKVNLFDKIAIHEKNLAYLFEGIGREL